MLNRLPKALLFQKAAQRARNGFFWCFWTFSEIPVRRAWPPQKGSSSMATGGEMDACAQVGRTPPPQLAWALVRRPQLACRIISQRVPLLRLTGLSLLSTFPATCANALVRRPLSVRCVRGGHSAQHLEERGGWCEMRASTAETIANQ